MEFHTQNIDRQKKHSLGQLRRRAIMTVCFLFIFMAGMFFSPLQMPASAATPPTPSLLTPANGATITATGSGPNASPPGALPEFSWTEVTGTTQYRIQISGNIGFSTSYDFTTELTHFIPPNVDLFNDGLWYWRVRVEGPVAGNYQFTPYSFIKQWASSDNKPILVSPAEAAVLEFYDQPTFSWQPVIGAAAYRFQISSAFNFSALLYNDLTLATSFQPQYKFSNGTRYWRVIPIDPAGREGIPSLGRSFIMGYNQVPELLEPLNNTFPTFTPTFRWKAVHGAQYYKLEYSTDPKLSSNIIAVETRNTTYTPVNTLPNDVNYYWHVRAYSGSSESDWSPIWTFKKQWTIRPVLLTPTNSFQHIRLPYFSWTPVPGASIYRIELDDNTSFVDPILVRDETSNTFYTPREFNSAWNIVYWRVIPRDADGNWGKESATFSFSSHYTDTLPTLVSPLYYYPPNSFPPPFNTVAMQPYADRTVSWPIFFWNRLTNPPLTASLPSGATATTAYRIQVSTSPSFSTINWTVDTQNTHAAPTIGNPFTPVAGQDYFWRVCPLSNGCANFWDWSQIWKARFSLTNPNDPPTSPPPQLRRPFNGSEIVETTPLLEWWSVAGADSYSVQISDDPAFATVLNSGVVRYPAYSPVLSLAQRSLGQIKYGTYYWRVQARSGGNPLGGWSAVRRFQIASQSERVEARTFGSANNRLLVASDPVDAADPNYEVTTLYGMQDSDYWYFGFKVPVTNPSMTYVLYLDLDHKDNSGAASDALSYSISTIPAHRPEYAIYIDRVAGAFDPYHALIYGWNGASWNDPGFLGALGGDLFYDGATGYLEVKLYNTSIGMADETGSYAVSLFSVPTGGGTVADSVPSDPNVPGSGPISRLVSVSERMNTITPQYTAQGDPTTDPFVYPFTFDYPTGSNGSAPWAGNWVRVYRDPDFTTEIAQNEERSNTPYYAYTSHHWPYDFLGDNTYYWRIQPCYLFDDNRVCGVWSQGVRFERKGFVPQNLQESVTFATPTFSWGLVEGAKYYDLQVDDNDNFASPIIADRTAQVSYTPRGTLPGGTYYWRVDVVRENNATSQWSSPKTFTLTLPQPAGLTPNDPNPAHAIHTTPTFCWQHLIASANGTPVLAAWRYLLQISLGDPTFSNVYEQVDTEQSCWTPRVGYADGTYYWRVAMMDGDGRFGSFSPAAVFTKQYPAAKPLSPVTGSYIAGTPTFRWTAADGITPYVFGASRYRLEVSQFQTFSPLYEQVDTTNTSYTPTRLYQENRTYYWRVAIIDRDGKFGPFSNATLIINSFPFHVYLPGVLYH